MRIDETSLCKSACYSKLASITIDAGFNPLGTYNKSGMSAAPVVGSTT